MQFENFEIAASPFITKAYCRDCHESLVQVSNGWFSKAMFCPKCENVYVVKLVKVQKAKINKEFLEQARKESNKSFEPMP
ncbi:MAG: hypothetical protein ACFFDT_40005 [Candidatus Hodarchaeota archaeon]